MGITEYAVVIAGSGPAGMMLAAELALAGVEAAVIERRTDQALAGSRAGGFQSRTVEVFDQRGIADRFLAGAQQLPKRQVLPARPDFINDRGFAERSFASRGRYGSGRSAQAAQADRHLHGLFLEFRSVILSFRHFRRPPFQGRSY